VFGTPPKAAVETIVADVVARERSLEPTSEIVYVRVEPPAFETDKETFATRKL
jgi:purine nucleoside phosphorylase